MAGADTGFSKRGGGGLRPALRNAGWGVSASGPIAVPYMKGGVATPNPPPHPPGSASVWIINVVDCTLKII